MSASSYGAAWSALKAQARQIHPPICHLCLRPIDLTLSGRDPWGWSLDHLDPVALAGSDVPDVSRVRPAHMRCNSRRGKRPVQQRPRSRQW